MHGSQNEGANGAFFATPENYDRKLILTLAIEFNPLIIFTQSLRAAWYD